MVAAPIALVVTGPAAALTHTVEPGDAVWSIAARHGVDVDVLVAVNDLDDPSLILPGDTLTVPETASGTAVAVVGNGDTLWSIAQHHDVDLTTLRNHNRIAPDAVILPGQLLFVPDADPSASPALDVTNVESRLTGSEDAAPSVLATGLGHGSPTATAPRVRPLALQRDPERLALEPIFERWASAYGVPPDLLRALTWYESGWDNERRSSAGAIGIGQLLPITADFVIDMLHVELDPDDPADNIRLSARYLRYLIDETGAIDAAVASWYQGRETTRRDGIGEATRRYVDGVMALRSRFG